MKKTLLFSSLFVLMAFLADGQTYGRKAKKTEKRIKADITYLASDELEGRLTGSPGEKLSAEFIASRFKSYGLKPKGEDGTYYQTFEITTLRMATDNSQLFFGGMQLKQFVDFYPLSISANQAHFKGITVDVGFGINSDKPLRNDYEGLDVKGKTVIVDLSSPDGIHPHSAYLAWHGIESRVNEAIKQGASAVIFYRNSDQVDKPDGNLSLKIKPASIPVLFVTRELKSLPPGSPVEIKVDIKAITEKGHNVIAFKDNKAANTVVIGAHHDHLGRGEMGNSLSVEHGLIHNGADDNASGISGLLDLARSLSKSKKWSKNNNYLFIAFSGEELGLLGSKHFVDNPTIALSSINYMINLDMIGKLDSLRKVLVINGVGTSPEWNATIGKIKLDTNNIKEIKTTESGIGASDHTSFYLKNIPAIHFFTGQHVHYHKPSDDVEIINFRGEVLVINYIIDVVKLLNDQGRIKFTETKSTDSTGRMKFAVTLGIMPDYLYSGEGVMVDGVKDNMPGFKAGLLKGDLIVSLNGVFINDMKTYMKVLSELKKGMYVPLQIKRNNEMLDLNVQF